MSPNMERLLGWPADSFLGAGRFDVMDPAELPRWRALRAQVEAEGSGTGRFRLRSRDHGWRWIELAISTVGEGEGREPGFLGAVRDVTAQVEADRALAEVGARYRTLFDSLTEGFCVVEVIRDADGRTVDYRFLETNAAYAAQTGLVGVVGRTAREIVPGLEEHWFELYGRVADTGEAEKTTAEVAAMDRAYDVLAFRVGDSGSQVGILFADVTERRRMERSLAESERVYRLLVETGTDVVIFYRPDWTVAYISPTIERLIGFPPEAFVDKARTDLIPPGDLPLLLRIQEEAAETGTAQGVIRVRNAEGRLRWLELTLNGSDEEAEPGYRAPSRDVTIEVEYKGRLAESEGRYRLMVEAGRDVIALYEPDWTVVYVSPNITWLSGPHRRADRGHEGLSSSRASSTPTTRPRCAGPSPRSRATGRRRPGSASATRRTARGSGPSTGSTASRTPPRATAPWPAT
jgi:PAS domain S-box-containing protein